MGKLESTAQVIILPEYLIEDASCGKKSKAQKGIGRLVIPHLRPVTAFAVKVACFFSGAVLFHQAPWSSHGC